MLTIVLGAPGSGKSTIARRLRSTLPGCAVIDWDDFMPAVEALGGRDVRTSVDLWAPYGDLVRSVVTALSNVPVVVLGVRTPLELGDWPGARWVLLDCDDDERRRRLEQRPPHEVDDALTDAEAYRGLGLEVIDSTGRTVGEVADEIAEVLDRPNCAGLRAPGLGPP